MTHIAAPAAFFRAASLMRSAIPSDRVAAVGTLFVLARGHERTAGRARDLLAAEFGPLSLEFGEPAGGCAAPHAATRVCEALGWDCSTCAFRWAPEAAQAVARG